MEEDPTAPPVRWLTAEEATIQLGVSRPTLYAYVSRNRIGTLEQELTQLGVGVEARADGLAIRGGTPRAAQLKSHGDHRIAMAAAIAANALDGESTVRGWGAVSSSYPAFADHLAHLTR